MLKSGRMGLKSRGQLSGLSLLQLLFVLFNYCIYDFFMLWLFYFSVLGQKKDTTFVIDPHDKAETNGQSSAQFYL